MRFKYKAQKADGTLYEGERDASDKYTLAHELKVVGEALVFAQEAGAASGLHFNLQRIGGLFGRVGIHDKIIFTRNLGGMLKAGLAVSRALAVLERQTKNRALKRIIVALSEHIGKGITLHEALADFPFVFPPLVVGMVRAGEEGGKLASSLAMVAEQLDRSYFLRRKVRGALMYPAVVFSLMVVVGIVMLVYIVPKLTAAFAEFNVALPLPTRIILATSDFLQNNLFLGAIILVFAVVAIVAAKRSARGRRVFDFVSLHIPLLSSLVREVNAARTGRTLSALLSSGVPIVGALEITASVVQNSYYRDVLLRAKDTIAKGELMSAVFRANEDIYPPFLSEMVAVGEETGRLSEMLEETGSFFESEVDQKTKDVSTLIEPLLMIVVGVAVGFFAMAMITPIYSLMNSI